MAAEEPEETYGWEVSVIFLGFMVISIGWQIFLALISFLNSFYGGAKTIWLNRLKEEVLDVGVISLVLVFLVPQIDGICVDSTSSEPSTYPSSSPYGSKYSPPPAGYAGRHLLAPLRQLLAASGGASCPEGKRKLFPSSTIATAHYLLFFVALVHILYSLLTFSLTLQRFSRWSKWERLARMEAADAADVIEEEDHRALMKLQRRRHLSCGGRCKWFERLMVGLMGGVSPERYFVMRGLFQLRARFYKVSSFVDNLHFTNVCENAMEIDIHNVVSHGWLQALIVAILTLYPTVAYQILWIGGVCAIGQVIIVWKMLSIIKAVVAIVQVADDQGAPVYQIDTDAQEFQRLSSSSSYIGPDPESSSDEDEDAVASAVRGNSQISAAGAGHAHAIGASGATQERRHKSRHHSSAELEPFTGSALQAEQEQQKQGAAAGDAAGPGPVAEALEGEEGDQAAPPPRLGSNRYGPGQRSMHENRPQPYQALAVVVPNSPNDLPSGQRPQQQQQQQQDPLRHIPARVLPAGSTSSFSNPLFDGGANDIVEVSSTSIDVSSAAVGASRSRLASSSVAQNGHHHLHSAQHHAGVNGGSVEAAGALSAAAPGRKASGTQLVVADSGSAGPGSAGPGSAGSAVTPRAMAKRHPHYNLPAHIGTSFSAAVASSVGQRTGSVMGGAPSPRAVGSITSGGPGPGASVGRLGSALGSAAAVSEFASEGQDEVAVMALVERKLRSLFWMRKPQLLMWLSHLAFLENSLSMTLCIYYMISYGETIFTVEADMLYVWLPLLAANCLFMLYVGWVVVPLYTLVTTTCTRHPRVLHHHIKRQKRADQEEEGGITGFLLEMLQRCFMRKHHHAMTAHAKAGTEHSRGGLNSLFMTNLANQAGVIMANDAVISKRKLGAAASVYREYVEIWRHKVRVQAGQEEAPAGGFTLQADVSEFWNAFKALDVDGSASVTTEELFTQLHVLGTRATKTELKSMISQIDNDGDKKVDFDEFVVFLVFCFFDENGNSGIEIPDIHKVLRKLRLPTSEQEVEAMIDLADPDGDRKIGLRQFFKLFKDVGIPPLPDQPAHSPPGAKSMKRNGSSASRIAPSGSMVRGLRAPSAAAAGASSGGGAPGQRSRLGRSADATATTAAAGAMAEGITASDRRLPPAAGPLAPHASEMQSQSISAPQLQAEDPRTRQPAQLDSSAARPPACAAAMNLAASVHLEDFMGVNSPSEAAAGPPMPLPPMPAPQPPTHPPSRTTAGPGSPRTGGGRGRTRIAGSSGVGIAGSGEPFALGVGGEY